ncbi:hypothetical protein FACS1894185_3040 [Betaproteobacteria bacterium]|nr:hypothetical protein FACS1894185_3040 [Betaproteobacteria bacterium]
MKTHSPFSTQRGITLVIVLVVLVALMLLSISLFRSVDTSGALTGNVAFKSDANNRAQLAFDQIIAWAGNKTNYMAYIDKGVDLANRNYSARMLATDEQGVPLVIKNASTFDAAWTASSSVSEMNTNEMRVRYLVERMCTEAGLLKSSKCTYVTEADLGGSGRELKSLPKPALRVTVRVDGPKNVVAYVQATVSP